MRGVEEAIADMRRRAEREGRHVRFGMNPFIGIDIDEEAGIQKILDQILQFDPDTDQRKLQRRMLPALKAGLIGQPENVIKQLGRYRDMGLELILCKMMPNVENVTKIGREIVTEAKKLN